ncbi:uncharacterized protein Tco025E_06789, partial [Trypanosoma conorhini]
AAAAAAARARAPCRSERRDTADRGADCLGWRCRGAGRHGGHGWGPMTGGKPGEAAGAADAAQRGLGADQRASRGRGVATGACFLPVLFSGRVAARSRFSSHALPAFVRALPRATGGVSDRRWRWWVFFSPTEVVNCSQFLFAPI